MMTMLGAPAGAPTSPVYAGRESANDSATSAPAPAATGGGVRRLRDCSRTRATPAAPSAVTAAPPTPPRRNDRRSSPRAFGGSSSAMGSLGGLLWHIRRVLFEVPC